MKWSQYNYILRSQKHGTFIYNSTTNSFVRISENLSRKIEAITDWDEAITTFEPEFIDILRGHNIIVSNDFDQKVLYKKKFMKYRSSFDSSNVALTIATTTNCNFRCPYCYESNLKPVTMKRDVEDAIIAYLKDTKKLRVTWYGGEPLMNFGTIKRLTERIGKLGKLEKLQYNLVTNGYFLDEQKCRFFADKELTLIQITLDGTRDVHNASRISKDGRPSFDHIVENIDRALRILPETVQIAVRVNIGNNNKDDFPVLFHELTARWKTFHNFTIYFGFIDDHGLCTGSTMNSAERMSYAKYLLEHHGIGSIFYPYSERGVCNANTIGSYVVSANGDLYKCWVDLGKEQRKVGTIFEPDKIGNLDLLIHYYVTDKFNDPKCLSCFLLPVCSGGCPIHRYECVANATTEDICPYQYQNIDVALEMMYERTLNGYIHRQ